MQLETKKAQIARIEQKKRKFASQLKVSQFLTKPFAGSATAYGRAVYIIMSEFGQTRVGCFAVQINTSWRSNGQIYCGKNWTQTRPNDATLPKVSSRTQRPLLFAFR